jgi:hypothetical protein
MHLLRRQTSSRLLLGPNCVSVRQACRVAFPCHTAWGDLTSEVQGLGPQSGVHRLNLDAAAGWGLNSQKFL